MNKSDSWIQFHAASRRKNREFYLLIPSATEKEIVGLWLKWQESDLLTIKSKPESHLAFFAVQQHKSAYVRGENYSGADSLCIEEEWKFSRSNKKSSCFDCRFRTHFEVIALNLIGVKEKKNARASVCLEKLSPQKSFSLRCKTHQKTVFKESTNRNPIN